MTSHLQFRHMTLGQLYLFTSAKVILDQRPQNTFSKNNSSCVLLSLIPTRSFLNGCCLVGVCFLGFMHSSSSSSASFTHSFTSRFSYFLETMCPYIEKYGHTPKLPANFRTNTVKYGCVGRSESKKLQKINRIANHVGLYVYFYFEVAYPLKNTVLFPLPWVLAD